MTEQSSSTSQGIISLVNGVKQQYEEIEIRNEKLERENLELRQQLLEKQRNIDIHMKNGKTLLQKAKQFWEEKQKLHLELSKTRKNVGSLKTACGNLVHKKVEILSKMREEKAQVAVLESENKELSTVCNQILDLLKGRTSKKLTIRDIPREIKALCSSNVLVPQEKRKKVSNTESSVKKSIKASSQVPEIPTTTQDKVDIMKQDILQDNTFMGWNPHLSPEQLMDSLDENDFPSSNHDEPFVCNDLDGVMNYLNPPNSFLLESQATHLRDHFGLNKVDEHVSDFEISVGPIDDNKNQNKQRMELPEGFSVVQSGSIYKADKCTCLTDGLGKNSQRWIQRCHEFGHHSTLHCPLQKFRPQLCTCSSLGENGEHVSEECPVIKNDNCGLCKQHFMNQKITKKKHFGTNCGGWSWKKHLYHQFKQQNYLAPEGQPVTLKSPPTKVKSASLSSTSTESNASRTTLFSTLSNKP